ncbi:hypothetical protein SAMN05661093_10725 [Kibdelosporangium aridum]|uniref:Uncharacterized protein n=1 Tax=Kibdelosporangium aridum TaxID=2030 RepID=A0A1W2FZT0_KIBAR|nr:hypothetical protein SAMN05661093_10725 [Kibdelosporangium aridum]
MQRVGIGVQSLGLFSSEVEWFAELVPGGTIPRQDPGWGGGGAGPIPAPPSSNTSVNVQQEIESASPAHRR